jgi:hypothetical protein
LTRRRKAFRRRSRSGLLFKCRFESQSVVASVGGQKRIITVAWRSFFYDLM